MNDKVPPSGGPPAEEVLASASMFLRDSFEELSKLDLLRESGEHQLNGQEVFNVPWKQTDAGISA